jgi:hypothetical protein
MFQERPWGLRYLRHYLTSCLDLKVDLKFINQYKVSFTTLTLKVITHIHMCVCVRMCIRLGQFQTFFSKKKVFHAFSVAWNPIKINSTYLRNLVLRWGQFYSTAVVLDTFYVKYCSVLAQNYEIDLNFALSF